MGQNSSFAFYFFADFVRRTLAYRDLVMVV
jgi:hypothetical protein